MANLLKTVVGVHMQKEPNTVEAVFTLYKTLGMLVSTLQRRDGRRARSFVQ